MYNVKINFITNLHACISMPIKKLQTCLKGLSFLTFIKFNGGILPVHVRCGTQKKPHCSSFIPSIECS